MDSLSVSTTMECDVVMALPSMTSDPAVSRPSRVERTLRALAGLSLAIPAVALTIGGYLTYSAAMADARQLLKHLVDVAHEHAERVFDTFDLVAVQISDLTQDLDAKDIRADEKKVHERLAGIVQSLPQIQDIWIIDDNARPLVSAKVYPMPPGLDLTDRQYFQVQKEQDRGVYVSEVLAGRAMPDARFFQMSWRRAARDGHFTGVTAVSVQPSYFRDFYARLAVVGLNSTSLLRADGRVLARFPTPALDLAAMTPMTQFVAALRVDPEQGIFRDISTGQESDRLVAYRRLPKHPVYVTAGVAIDSIRANWLKNFLQTAAIVIPASLGLFILSVVALRQSRREQLATTRLRAEAVRREQAEDALLQAQKMEAVGQLTGGVAHDFNNLLTVIVHHLDRIEHMPDAPAAAKRLAAAALAAAARGERLTQQLLAFARRQRLTPEDADLNDLLRDLASLIRRAVGEAVEVTLDLAPELGSVRVDRTQFEASILNLAVNARDAIGPAGGRIEISTKIDRPPPALPESRSPVRHWAQLRVSDTGGGIPADVLPRVFEPFFTTKDVGKGSGLGLSQVYGFVQQSGGAIALDSELGRGAAVTIWLPAAPPGSPKPAAVADPGAGTHFEPRGAGETILVVEDDADVREVAVETLATLGYEVVMAADGAEALDILAGSGKIDLLFTDIVMPGGISGEDLAERASRLRPGLPVLLASGYNAPREGAEPASHFPILRKPYRSEGLAREVAGLLAGAARQPAAPARAPRPNALRALVVEDDPLVLMSTVDMLREAGFEVVGEAASAEKALELLDRITPPVSALFTDLRLPGMDGRALARRARQKYPSLGIVLLTGYAEPGIDRGNGLIMMGKPFLTRDLERLRDELASPAEPARI